jgi:hypothetical protein
MTATTPTRPRWATGVANVIAQDHTGVLIHCPHCGGRHRHAHRTVGSRHVIAGCHKGHSLCREYAVVGSLPAGGRR